MTETKQQEFKTTITPSIGEKVIYCDAGIFPARFCVYFSPYKWKIWEFPKFKVTENFAAQIKEMEACAILMAMIFARDGDEIRTDSLASVSLISSEKKKPRALEMAFEISTIKPVYLFWINRGNNPAGKKLEGGQNSEMREHTIKVFDTPLEFVEKAYLKQIKYLERLIKE